ncbi:GNAT family N-acetyltransferase [Paenibacillus sp.]|uniref:GNAT family N-acetyltransferase n=1 Tax=Paenibacillus sp. TaxID=58172 RepID=UPI0028121832|nr:GNAT family N-acetyltransferase [Paenibacillus sp.]
MRLGSLMTEPLYGTLERSESEYMLDRMTAIRERAGNPEGVEFERFGGALAFYSKSMPWPQFNTVKLLSEEEIDVLDDIIEFYQARGRIPQFEITPGNGTKKLFQALHSRGYYQSGFHASLYAEPTGSGLPAVDDSIRIREIGKEEAELYATIHCRGTGLGDDGIPYVASNNEVLMGRAGWRFYVAEWHGEPGAVGVMFAKDRTASLTFAATLPEFRNRGLQTALIARRMREARTARCELVVGQASYASQSSRNMERTGMRLGYTRATWSKG